MTVTDRSIIVIDHFAGKQIFYDRLTLQPVSDIMIYLNKSGVQNYLQLGILLII